MDESNKSQINDLENFIEKFIKYSEKEKEVDTAPNVTINTSIHAFTKDELNQSKNLLLNLKKK